MIYVYGKKGLFLVGAMYTYFLQEPHKLRGIVFFLDDRPVIPYFNLSSGLAVDVSLDVEEETLPIILVQLVCIHCLCGHEFLCLVIQDLHGLVDDVISSSILGDFVYRVLLRWNEGF